MSLDHSLPPEETADMPDDGSVVALRGHVLQIEDGPHPLNRTRQAEIDAHWKRELAANPSLFNGRIVLQRQVACRDGAIVARGYLSDFATFLWWRNQPDLFGASHIFGYPVIVSAEGHLIAIRMGGHTANPGQVYFAAGSLDASDIVDGHCDLEGNMKREVREETGLDLEEAETDGTLYGSYRFKKLTLFRLYRFSRSTAFLISSIRAHIGTDHDEIDDAVVISDASPLRHRYNPAMIPLLEWFFEARAPRR